MAYYNHTIPFVTFVSVQDVVLTVKEFIEL